ncbi:MAG: cold shock domain-containing protein [Pseudomonadota bacterium]
MQSGVVKWFNNAKGYGFILGEDGESNIFVHYSSIEMDGYKTLKAGQEVTFSVEPGPKGLHVTRLEVPGVIGPQLPSTARMNSEAPRFTQAEHTAMNIEQENKNMFEL